MKKRGQRMMRKEMNKRGEKRKHGDLPNHYPWADQPTPDRTENLRDCSKSKKPKTRVKELGISINLSNRSEINMKLGLPSVLKTKSKQTKT